MSAVLLTGGAGYIGSHVAVELASAGHDVVVIDDLRNSEARAVEVAAELAGRPIPLHVADIGDRERLDEVLDTYDIDSVIHLAGSKAVGESVADPLAYYRNNVGGSLVLLQALAEHGVRKFVFSSSCTVYGEPQELPLTESSPIAPVNPYGHTKWHIEQMLMDLAASDSSWEIALLRYFNPVGAHESGRIGEEPRGVPNNLVPFVMQTAAGIHPTVRVFGADYPTSDGTCIRDYLHVVDLADAHLAALGRSRPGCEVINLGTGTGHSVLEVIAASERAVGRPIPHVIADRRPGDATAAWTDTTHAREYLGWEAKRDLDTMCADAWRWQQSLSAQPST